MWTRQYTYSFELFLESMSGVEARNILAISFARDDGDHGGDFRKKKINSCCLDCTIEVDRTTLVCSIASHFGLWGYRHCDDLDAENKYTGSLPSSEVDCLKGTDNDVLENVEI